MIAADENAVHLPHPRNHGTRGSTVPDYIAQIPDHIIGRRSFQHSFQRVNIRMDVGNNQSPHGQIEHIADKDSVIISTSELQL
jgi:hypothetical protein